MYPAAAAVLVSLASLPATFAHDHHEVSDDDQAKPIDLILRFHIFIQFAVWGLIFPIGMVFGLVRQKYHVPLQALGFVLTAAGYILGHSHKGRSFGESAHEHMASLMLLPIVAQFTLGVYLKLHIHEGTRFRMFAVKTHGVIGVCFPLLGWVQMLFGIIVLGGFCRGDHLGQCLAHHIMGSSFVAYGVLSLILLLAAREWLPSKGQSLEYVESWIIMIWGAVNTFTEHRGSKWSKKDMQHTSLGIIWWAGGFLGVYLSRNEKRSFIPALIIALTGWAMSAHEQATVTSTKVHLAFGASLASSSIVRMIDIAWHENRGSLGPPPQALQHMTPLLLIAAGLIFMAATDEELRYIDGLEMDHVTYTLLLFSVTFLIYLISAFLIRLYLTTGRNNSSEAESRETEYQPLFDTSQNIVQDEYEMSHHAVSPK